MDHVAERVTAWAQDLPHVTVLRMRSHDAAALCPDDLIDFWHTDGNHEYDMVKLDIESWLPKVRPGSWLTGDNYEAASVARAVDQLLPERILEARGRVWCARK